MIGADSDFAAAAGELHVNKLNSSQLLQRDARPAVPIAESRTQRRRRTTNRTAEEANRRKHELAKEVPERTRRRSATESGLRLPIEQRPRNGEEDGVGLRNEGGEARVDGEAANERASVDQFVEDQKKKRVGKTIEIVFNFVFLILMLILIHDLDSGSGLFFLLLRIWSAIEKVGGRGGRF